LRERDRLLSKNQNLWRCLGVGFWCNHRILRGRFRLPLQDVHCNVGSAFWQEIILAE
jgi:hypothetical protein